MIEKGTVSKRLQLKLTDSSEIDLSYQTIRNRDESVNHQWLRAKLMSTSIKNILKILFTSLNTSDLLFWQLYEITGVITWLKYSSRSNERESHSMRSHSNIGEFAFLS